MVGTLWVSFAKHDSLPVVDSATLVDFIEQTLILGCVDGVMDRPDILYPYKIKHYNHAPLVNRKNLRFGHY